MMRVRLATVMSTAGAAAKMKKSSYVITGQGS